MTKGDAKVILLVGSQVVSFVGGAFYHNMAIAVFGAIVGIATWFWILFTEGPER